MADKEDHVLLVDQNDRVIGREEKLKAHVDALLHRAFSIFIFRKVDENCELLLQKRADHKYHSGGKWANSCCSHPKADETLDEAVERRLSEELGIKCKLEHHGYFIYKDKVGKNLIEHELDHVFSGWFPGGKISLDPDEISEICWMSIRDVEEKYKSDPELFAVWFKPAWERIKEKGVLKDYINELR